MTGAAYPSRYPNPNFNPNLNPDLNPNLNLNLNPNPNRLTTAIDDRSCAEALRRALKAIPPIPSMTSAQSTRPSTSLGVHVEYGDAACCLAMLCRPVSLIATAIPRWMTPPFPSVTVSHHVRHSVPLSLSVTNRHKPSLTVTTSNRKPFVVQVIPVDSVRDGRESVESSFERRRPWTVPTGHKP